MCRFCSFILSGFSIERHFTVAIWVMITSKLDTACNRLFALLLLSVSQFQAISPNWSANSRLFHIASSALSIDGKSAKKTPCASCLSTHRVRHKLSNVLLSSGVSFSTTAGKDLLRLKLQALNVPSMFVIRGRWRSERLWGSDSEPCSVCTVYQCLCTAPRGRHIRRSIVPLSPTVFDV